MLRGTPLGLSLLVSFAPVATQAQERLIPATPEIERAAHAVWINGGNYLPLCIGPDSLADQQGYQGLQQRPLPGQWIVRFARTPRRESEIRQHDHLAKYGLLERRESHVTIGPIQAGPAVEYRLTLAGWAQSLATSEAQSPCFYTGMTKFLGVTGYSESAKDAGGYSKVRIHFRSGGEASAPWAAAPKALELFYRLRVSVEGQSAAFDFARDPDGKLRLSRESKPIDNIVLPATTELPGIGVVHEILGKTQTLAKPIENLPKPCLPLLSKYMPQLWQDGADPTVPAVFELPSDKGSSRTVAVLAYERLRRLEQAGLVSLRGNPERGGQILVTPSPTLRPVLAQHRNCLPLGKVRMEVAGVLRGSGHGPRFKARYVVEEPEHWIKAIREKNLLPDLVSVLQDGQPFEGTVVRMRDGLAAAYLQDLRPVPAAASLDAIGVSPSWVNTTERGVSDTSIANHDVHLVSAYRADAVRDAEKRSMGRIEVRVKNTGRAIIVVLSGYEPIEWQFRPEKGARIRAVLAVGYHEQKISGLPADTAAVTAYTDDGASRIDAAMTRAGRIRESLVSLLGVNPVSAQSQESAVLFTVGGK